MCFRGERKRMDMHICRWCGLCSSCLNKQKQACKVKENKKGYLSTAYKPLYYICKDLQICVH